MKAVLDDPATAPIPEAERALFGFVEKMTRASNRLTLEDVDRLREAGWSEEAIYDAVTVCALFNFYNVWVDATGVADMSPEAYAASGRRLAEYGYAVDRPAVT